MSCPIKTWMSAPSAGMTMGRRPDECNESLLSPFVLLVTRRNGAVQHQQHGCEWAGRSAARISCDRRQEIRRFDAQFRRHDAGLVGIRPSQNDVGGGSANARTLYDCEGRLPRDVL